LTHRYRAYGVQIAASGEIDGLPPSHSSHVDCTIEESHFDWPAGAIPIDTSVYIADDPGFQAVRTNDAYFFRFADGSTFRIAGDGRSITTCGAPSRDDMSSYLAGSILAFALRLQGRTVFHASGVVTESGKGILIAGGSGAGKSTLAAALLERGARLLTDDVAVVSIEEGHARIEPGYPRVRLWDDSARSLFPGVTLPWISPNWDKRFADCDTRFARESVPLDAIFALESRADDALTIRELAGKEKVMAMISRMSLSYLLEERHRAGELDDATRLATRVRVFAARCPDDLVRLGETVTAMLQAVET
jgi:hypothetical protein